MQDDGSLGVFTLAQMFMLHVGTHFATSRLFHQSIPSYAFIVERQLNGLARQTLPIVCILQELGHVIICLTRLIRVLCDYISGQGHPRSRGQKSQTSKFRYVDGAKTWSDFRKEREKTLNTS